VHGIFYSIICNPLSLHSTPHRTSSNSPFPVSGVQYIILSYRRSLDPGHAVVWSQERPAKVHVVCLQRAEFMPKLCPRSKIGGLSLPKKQLDISLFTYLSLWRVIKNNEMTFRNLHLLLCKGNACCSAAVIVGSRYV